MKCTKCQFENPDGAKFCIECGHPMEFRCPKCGAITSAKGKFCMECGHPLGALKEVAKIDYSAPQSYTPKHLADKILTTRTSIEGERKLVTVLFADVANFTGLSSKLDPEEVHQIMDGCFRILMDEIHKYEGTINQFTGDGVMALFGAPVAHEDHAQRACHGGLAIQKAMQGYGEKIKGEYGVEFRMRMGINSGPVIVGPIGDDLRMDYTAIGDTTNLASRMESAAKPGSVLVTRNTHRLAKDFFKFEALGQIEVKGKEEPQEAYQLIGAGGASTRIEAAVARGLTNFVGRENSIAALMEAYEKAKRGSGQVVGVVGEAGVGKSRLLFEFRNRLPQEEYTYLEGRCIHFGGNMPYLPILDILRSYFEIVEGERETLVKKRISESVLGLDQKLAHVIPSIQEILSLKVEDEEYLKLDPKAKRERVFEALRDLLVKGSQVRPLVLAVEDLHWIDKTTEEFLNYFIGCMANLKVMLVLLYRPEYTHQWGNKSYFNRIGVDQLTLQSSAELVKAILEGGEAAPELKDLILNRAAGNPFFMEELTHTLLENGSIQKENNQYVLAGTASKLQVPETVQGTIAARIDRLEENLKRIMQVASVIGREFAFRILQSISDMRSDLKTQLLNLQGLEFIYEKNLFPELEYIFKHALTQEVAYNSLLLKRRKEIHERIGNAVENLYAERLEEFCEMLAYHYARGDNTPKACHYLKLSGDKARKTYSTLEAFGYYSEAAKVLRYQPDSSENRGFRLAVLQPIAELITTLGYPEGSFEFLKEGEQLAGVMANKKALAHFQTLIGIFHLTSLGDPAKGREYIEKGLGEADLTGESGIIIGATMTLIFFSAFEGRYSSICQMAPKTIERIEKANAELEHFGKGYNNYSVLLALYGMSLGITGNFSHGRPFLEKGLSFALNLNDIISLGMIEQSFGRFYYELGDGENMAKHLRSCIEYYEKSKLEIALGTVWGMLGKAYLFLGQTESALQSVHKGLDMHKAAGASLWLGYRYTVLGEVNFEMGNFENALAYCRQAVPLCQNNNEKPEEAQALISLGRVIGLTSTSGFEEARDLILKGTNMLQGLEQKPRYATGIFHMGELYANAGRKEEALENLKQAEGMFQEMGMDYWLNRTRGILARL